MDNHVCEFDKYRVSPDCWATVFEIFQMGFKKYIRYDGFGYYSETGIEDDPTPYRIVDYAFFEAPLKDVLEFEKTTGESYESEYGPDEKQYISDCSYEELIDTYEHWANDAPPQPLPPEGLTLDTPCGAYFG